MSPSAQSAAVCLLASSLLALYASPLSAMVRQWNASPMYSYAFTVPLISLYVLWSRREEFARVRPRPLRLFGGIVVAGALALLVVGEAAAIQIAQQVSFLVALVGLVLLLFGLPHLKIAAPGLGYLLFMLPFWDVFTEPLHWPFQQNSARMGLAIMHAVGVPAYREGTVIALPNVTIEVARACSGVNYLIAVLALALPLSFLRLRSPLRRVVLVAFALIIAALANGLRVALIGVLAHLEIGSPLHGPFHVLHGLFVAGIGYGALFAGLHWLESRPERPEETRPASAMTGGELRWSPRDACAIAAVFLALAVLGTSPRPVPVALAMPLEMVPTRLGPWEADVVRVDGPNAVVAWNEADHRLRRRYYRPDGHAAIVDVWYYEAQRQSREIVSFKADSLHRQAVPRAIPLPDGSRLTANVVRLPGEVGLFWYVLDGTAETGKYAAKARSLWTALRAGHSNGAAVMLRARTSDAADENVLAALQDLAAEVHMALERHWHPAAARPAHEPATPAR